MSARRFRSLPFWRRQSFDAKDRGRALFLGANCSGDDGCRLVSDPIVFGRAVRAFFPDVFARHGEALRRAGVNANDGMAALLSALDRLPEDERDALEADEAGLVALDCPALASVDSWIAGITNLHVPSDVIIDASIPAAIRSSGQMWNADGEQQDTKFVIPDHSYAPLYAEAIKSCREHGAFDPATMGTTPNVGLMAQKAEEA